MNMKKLLSIGVLSLAIASCTSVTTFAATTPSLDQITGILSQYKSGANISDSLKINKNTPINSFVEIAERVNLNGHQRIKNGLDKVVSKLDKNGTVGQNLDKILNNITEKDFNKLKSKLPELRKKLESADKISGVERAKKEAKAAELVGAYDSSLELKFGKNSQGQTTASLEKDGKVIGQLSYDQVQALIDLADQVSYNEIQLYNKFFK